MTMGVTLDQSNLIENILRKFNYFDNKLVSTLNSNMHLKKNVGKPIVKDEALKSMT